MSAVTAVPLRPLAKGSVLKLWIAVGLLVLIAAGLGWWSTNRLQRTAMPNGVSYQVIREGSGELISSADIAAINFVARRQNGEVIADTRRDRPVETTTDTIQVPGLGDGLKLMRKGAIYRFWVPPSVWRGRVPPSAGLAPDEVLTFDVQVLEVALGAAVQQRLQQMQELQQSGGNAVAPAPAGNAAAPAPAGAR